MSKFVQNLNIPVPMDWILWLMHSWSEFPHDLLHTGNLKRGINYLPEQGFPSSRSHLHVVQELLRVQSQILKTKKKHISDLTILRSQNPATSG